MQECDLFCHIPYVQWLYAVSPVALSLSDVGGLICLSDVWSRRG